MCRRQPTRLRVTMRRRADSRLRLAIRPPCRRRRRWRPTVRFTVSPVSDRSGPHLCRHATGGEGPGTDAITSPRMASPSGRDRVRQWRRSANKFGVVLIIDASRSMHGTPINAAMEAARTFAAHREPEQPLAVIVFNHTTTCVLPFTTDEPDRRRAHGAPAPGTGTHMIDAVQRRAGVLAAAHITSASMVVLSDGADTGSLPHSTRHRQARAEGIRASSRSAWNRSVPTGNLGPLASGGRQAFTAAARAGSCPTSTTSWAPSSRTSTWSLPVARQGRQRSDRAVRSTAMTGARVPSRTRPRSLTGSHAPVPSQRLVAAVSSG